MYYLNPDIHCNLFLKKLINKNQTSIINIQSKIREDENVETQVIESINFNITQINKNQCISTFNKYNVNDFFSFYKTVFNNHKEQYIQGNKCRNETYEVLAFIDRFNTHLKKIKTKLKK